MFREDLALAKQMFDEVANDKALFKKVPQAAEAQATHTRARGPVPAVTRLCQPRLTGAPLLGCPPPVRPRR